MNDKKATVIKNNALVERTRYRLSVNEQRIVLTLISKVSPKDADFKEYSFKISELYKLLGFKRESLKVKQRGLTKILDSLQSKLIKIITSDKKGYGGREIKMSSSWIITPIIDEEMDLITLKITDVLKPYLLQLKKKFTRYYLSEVARFKCAHSFRFLEFCKNNEPRPNYHDKIINGRYVNIKIYELLELRLILGIPEKIYPKLANFKTRVLEASQREVNTKTKSHFEFEMIKNPIDRRRTKAVKMLIFGKFVWPIDVCRRKESEDPRPVPLPEPASSPPLPDIDPRDEGLWRRMLKLRVTSRLASIVLKSNYDRCKILSALEAIEDYQQSHKIKWPNRILNSALLDGWISKREVKRREENNKSNDKLAAIETKKNIEKGLVEKEKQREKAMETAHDQAIEDHQKQLEIWEKEFARTTDKTHFILNLRDDFASLKKRTRITIEKHIEQIIASGADFDEVYFEAGRMIIGFLLPNRIIMENDNEI